MSADACPACGEPVGEQLSLRGAVLRSHHQINGPECRLWVWEREVDRRGLVRVVGDTLKTLLEYDAKFVSYGPFWLTEAQAQRDVQTLLNEGNPRAAERYTKGLPKRVRSAFVPRWAYEIVRAFGSASQHSRAALELVAADEDLQLAVASAAVLAGTASGVRKAVAGFLSSYLENAK